MMVRSQFFTSDEAEPVMVENADGKGEVLLVCEHASRTLPARFGTLGLGDDVRTSHIAWDPGALDVTRLLSKSLDATIIYQNYSRLIYDCNRPPESTSAMPVTSEIFDIPGNRDLSDAERFARTSALYVPFHDRISDLISERKAAGRNTVLVTMHSFTPIYHGAHREVEIGILHDADSRLADAMLDNAGDTAFNVQRNEPYGPQDGVTHTLRLHALPNGLLNVMIEVRNDLIRDEEGQRAAADVLDGLLRRAIAVHGL
ncbi:N-formylglutamate amidohydrolase [Agrobacterium sp. rho-13.3]|uniref:N-formylglutamate amidohydrolase n=1 Tax=Agrobacterium sp. rho-13.3 TaxID=3072980 RepID=UPI002A11FD59|nr:N-formylglutamate amidohydrolase [Agrobacterium sp. rho-13.3]MDX8310083.1 N-formylglutamate amidohydrolase [Agrobacterium sp. rho-13.3]